MSDNNALAACVLLMGRAGKQIGPCADREVQRRAFPTESEIAVEAPDPGGRVKAPPILVQPLHREVDRHAASGCRLPGLGAERPPSEGSAGEVDPRALQVEAGLHP